MSQNYWENVYASKSVDAVSWFQQHATTSMQLLNDLNQTKNAQIIDVGGGASVFVDDLMASLYTNLTVLDLSESALQESKKRLGKQSEVVKWLVSDVTTVDLAKDFYDVWHDRAVFHFLTDSDDRQAYIHQVLRSVKKGGHVIIATFAEDGPTQCSGLPIVQYSSDALSVVLGEHFQLMTSAEESHQTPFNTIQKFNYCVFELI